MVSRVVVLRVVSCTALMLVCDMLTRDLTAHVRVFLLSFFLIGAVIGELVIPAFTTAGYSAGRRVALSVASVVLLAAGVSLTKAAVAAADARGHLTAPPPRG